MKNDEIWTIELNLDDDFSSSCAYHIDSLIRTITHNIQHAETGKKTDRWVLIGLAYGSEEALEKVHEIRMLLCKKHNKVPEDLP